MSVVIPAYNSERFVARAIRSVLRQTYPSLECIVVDDGSTDGTAGIVEKFGDRVRLITQRNSGASAARNAGIDATRGRFIAFLDSDDYWARRKLEIQVAAMLEHPELALVCCDFSWVPWGVDPEIINDTDADPESAHGSLDIGMGLRDLLADPYLGTPTVLVDAERANAIGGFDTSLRVGEDIDFYFRLCADRQFARIRQRLVYCQLRPGSLTASTEGYRQSLEVFSRLVARHPALAHEVRDMIERRRGDIYREWVEALIFRGEGAEARIVLRQCRNESISDGYSLLYWKSYFSYLIRGLRRIRRWIRMRLGIHRQGVV